MANAATGGIANMTKRKEKAIKCCIEEVSARNSETGRAELYFVVDGQRIAKRGYPGTPQAQTWIPLVEGVSFHDEFPDDGTPIFEAGEVQLMSEPKGAK